MRLGRQGPFLGFLSRMRLAQGTLAHPNGREGGAGSRKTGLATVVGGGLGKNSVP